MTSSLDISMHRRNRNDTGLDVVTGAFSYSGRAIARALIDKGRAVRTITGQPERGLEHPDVEVRPLDFDDQLGLVESQRIVHISITNPSIESRFPYFRGKALVERALAESGVSYAVLRPAILFGGDGVLINNIAWLLRRLPVFAVGGDGKYRVRGIHVDDLAQLCLQVSEEANDSVTDAVGPERPTFNELVTSVREAVGARSHVVHVPGAWAPVLSSVLGLALHDVLLTEDEYWAMAAGLADTDGPSTGHSCLSAWITERGSSLGIHYANELSRHFS
jgi:nucleoside-diphosphate-sugar epimerase